MVPSFSFCQESETQYKRVGWTQGWRWLTWQRTQYCPRECVCQQQFLSCVDTCCQWKSKPLMSHGGRQALDEIHAWAQTESKREAGKGKISLFQGIIDKNLRFRMAIINEKNLRGKFREALLVHEMLTSNAAINVSRHQTGKFLTPTKTGDWIKSNHAGTGACRDT